MRETSNNKSQNSNMLSNRLDFNEKYSNADFHSWLFNNLDNLHYETTLDVGCGKGNQSLHFSKKAKKVCAFDISPQNIQFINHQGASNIEAIVGSMNEIQSVLPKFSVDRFDLIHSSFAMYYADNPLQLLQELFDVLSEKGSFAISAPHSVHTFLSFLSQYQTIPAPAWDCLEFINDIVLGFCHNHFKHISTHLFVNHLFVDSLEDLMENYLSSTFYSKEKENTVFKAFQKEIKTNGHFHIQKNSKLLLASQKIIPIR